MKIVNTNTLLAEQKQATMERKSWGNEEYYLRSEEYGFF
jgi:hypothetical protein